MFSVHDPGKMFSKQVLGTRAFRLRALWYVLGTRSFRFKIGTHLGLRSIHCAMCEVILTCTLCADSGLRAKPRPLRTCFGFTSFRLRFGGVLRGRFVPRTWFDRVPAGTVLTGTWLFRTRSDYKKWCVPRTCSRWNCTENKCERPAKELRFIKCWYSVIDILIVTASISIYIFLKSWLFIDPSEQTSQFNNLLNEAPGHKQCL